MNVKNTCEHEASQCRCYYGDDLLQDAPCALYWRSIEACQATIH